MSPIFSLIGDANLLRHINKNSCRANPALKSAQMLTCGSSSIFAATLEKVRETSTACIVACVTSFLTDAEGPSTLSLRVDPVLQEFCASLLEACSLHQDQAFLISPPLYRVHPLWYREGLPEIMSLFSQILNTDKPANLHLLSSFATPEFEANGVHLTAYSGLEYVLHLFDGAADLLTNLEMPLPEKSIKSSESTRVLEDRVMALEQDHRRLNRVVESKTAVDAELADFRANESTEDFFVLSGLPRISGDLIGKAWQDQAVKDVDGFITRLMGRSLSIVFVKNSTQRYEDAEVTYSVQMSNVQDSRAIRTKFGSFFLGGDKRPAEFKPYSVKNFVTPETRIRISLLKLLAKKYRESNPGSKVQVIGWQPRPKIKITPAASASDRRVMQFNFVQAVTRLPCQFAPSDLEAIARRINPDLLGKVRSLFVVLSDDMVKKRPAKEKEKPARQATTSAPAAAPDASVTDQSSDEDESAPDPPGDTTPAPPPTPPARAGSEAASGSKGSKGRSKSQKRGASSSLSSQAKK